MNPFRRAFLWTAVPIILVSLISTAGALDTQLDLYGAWAIAAGMWLVAVVAGIVLLFMNRRESASGVMVGVAVGVLALTVTCFANLSSFQFG
ncbi:MAG: hypothetical protein WD208_09135 [Dehalococcoidia bacterium]